MVGLGHDGSGAVALLSGISAMLDDWRPPMNTFRAYMVGQVRKQIMQAGSVATGGTSRGVRWGRYGDQYTRRDGTVITAWGGQQKVRGEGQVKGARKASGERITQYSRLYGNFKPGSLLRVHRTTPTSIEIGSPTSGPAVYLEEMRQYAFYTQRDQRAFDAICTKWARAELKSRERSA